MNNTPAGERTHIGFFGKRNVGKSSLLNAVTGQDFAVVSSVAGTTTDIVRKAMELLPLGAVLIFDTPGYDDAGELGELRVRQTSRALAQADLAVVVVDASVGLAPEDLKLIEGFRKRGTEYLIAFNKADLGGSVDAGERGVLVSAKTGRGIHELKERLARLTPALTETPLVRDLLTPGDTVVLVTPIDSAAPKGRLILPQQQMVRDALEGDGVCVVVKETGLADALAKLKEPPKMVITDSQAFKSVSADTPANIALTSFSILMARHKGYLEASVKGVRALERLKDGDTVLICEGCTHHRQCDDIGTVKLPRWLREYCGKDVKFEFASGAGYDDDLERFALIVHCGGCMLTAREVQRRVAIAEACGVPVTNYGVVIAQVHGILERCLSVFPQLLEEYRREED